MHIKATHCSQQLYRSLALVLCLCLAAVRWPALGQYCNEVFTLDSQVVHLCRRTIPMVIIGRWSPAAVARVHWQKERCPMGAAQQLMLYLCHCQQKLVSFLIEGLDTGQGTLRQSFCNLDECKGLSLLLSHATGCPDDTGFHCFSWSLFGQADQWIFIIQTVQISSAFIRIIDALFVCLCHITLSKQGIGGTEHHGSCHSASFWFV